MREIDLHVHTTASDGTLSPAQVVRLAADTGLRAIAITDHDTAHGYEEAAQAGAELGLEVVPGIEISTKFTGAVHILGYYIDLAAPALKAVLDWIVEDRDKRNRKMVELMSADGIPISYDGMLARFGDVIGRPHFARLLIELGYARDMQDAFDRYVEKGRKYYLPREILPIDRAIEIILSAGVSPCWRTPSNTNWARASFGGSLNTASSGGFGAWSAVTPAMMGSMSRIWSALPGNMAL